MKYKTVLLNELAYDKFDRIRRALSLQEGKNLSFSAAIMRIADENLRFTGIAPELVEYITAFAEELKNMAFISGSMLFGSVAKLTYQKYSDIDILIVTDSSFIETSEMVNRVIKSLDPKAQELAEKGLPYFISPVILTKKDLENLRPIYFDFADNGIPLFDKDGTLHNFINKTKNLGHWRENFEGKEVLRWKMNTT